MPRAENVAAGWGRVSDDARIQLTCMHRTHHCAQLSPSDIGASVSLIGWVDTIRDQGGIIFVDLRDRKGVTQIKLEPHDNARWRNS
jgi:aspartyl/asparaginyl-tRNA synthetase